MHKIYNCKHILLKLTILFYHISPTNAKARIRTFNHKITSRVFYHCVTAPVQVNCYLFRLQYD